MCIFIYILWGSTFYPTELANFFQKLYISVSIHSVMDYSLKKIDFPGKLFRKIIFTAFILFLLFSVIRIQRHQTCLYSYKVKRTIEKPIRRSIFPGKLSRKIFFHNFYSAFLTSLGHKRLMIPDMAVFILKNT